MHPNGWCAAADMCTSGSDQLWDERRAETLLWPVNAVSAFQLFSIQPATSSRPAPMSVRFAHRPHTLLDDSLCATLPAHVLQMHHIHVLAGRLLMIVHLDMISSSKCPISAQTSHIHHNLCNCTTLWLCACHIFFCFSRSGSAAGTTPSMSRWCDTRISKRNCTCSVWNKYGAVRWILILRFLPVPSTNQCSVTPRPQNQNEPECALSLRVCALERSLRVYQTNDFRRLRLFSPCAKCTKLRRAAAQFSFGYDYSRQPISAWSVCLYTFVRKFHYELRAAAHNHRS